MRILLSYDLGQTWVGREENTWGKNLIFQNQQAGLKWGVWTTLSAMGKGSSRWVTGPGVYFKVVQAEWSREGSGGSAGEREGVWRCCSYRQALHGAGFWGGRGGREEFPIQLMRLERPAGSWH